MSPHRWGWGPLRFGASLVILLPCCGCGDGVAADSAEPVACPALAVAVTEVDTRPLLPAPDDQRGPTGLAVADLDGDGAAEVILATLGGTLVFVPDGGSLAVSTTLPRGGTLPAALGVAGADIDLDGDVDLVFARPVGEPDLLLRNDGVGGFSVEELPDSLGQSATAAFADLDGDGRLDLVVSRTRATDYDMEDLIANGGSGDASSLYLWTAAGFVNASDRFPAEAHAGYTFHAAPLDADGDGDLDLWFANDAGPFVVPDLLLLNDGYAGFAVAEGVSLTHFGMGVGVGDANADGRADVFVTDTAGPDLLLGSGDGGFVDATLALHADLGQEPGRMVSWSTRFVDLDGDGLDDLPVAFGRGDQNLQDDVDLIDPTWVIDDDQRDALLLALPGQGFRDAGDTLGFSSHGRNRAMVALDLDDDAIPEVIVAGKDALTVYHPTGGCAGRLVVAVDGDAATPAIGATVVVTAGERSTTRWVLPSATGSASGTEVYAGLGDADTADVEVTWPDGRTATYAVNAGTTLTARPADAR